jgi:hypothetical protein
MNLVEFYKTFGNTGQKQKIPMTCSCGRTRVIFREKAEINIKDHGEYVCRACSMTQHHAAHPVEKPTREKQRLGRLGKKHTPEAKEKIRQVKNELYLTEHGKAIKKKLSHLAAKGHSTNKFNKSKRKGLFFSAKNNALRAYNSSYELRLCVELENDPEVVRYKTQVYYEIEDRCHSLDFLIEYPNKRFLAVEVKPKSRLTEQENIQQIKDSAKNAQQNNWEFEVYTEYHFGMKYKEIRDWADEFRKTLTGIDYAAHRRKNNCERTKRHYANKIATDTVDVFCEYCQTTHTALRLTYDKNIKRNGRYICEKEGGHIAGSKPKKKKFNPYAEQGMKQCTKCQRILHFECFELDKSRSDGYSNKCRECRRA